MYYQKLHVLFYKILAIFASAILFVCWNIQIECQVDWKLYFWYFCLLAPNLIKEAIEATKDILPVWKEH